MDYQSRTYCRSGRIERLRSRTMAWTPDQFLPWHRCYYYMEAWMAGNGQPFPIRNANALAHVIESMPVHLNDGELIVGEHGSAGDDWLGYPSFAPCPVSHIEQSIRDSSLSDGKKDQLASWLGSQPFAWQSLTCTAPWPADLQLAQDHGAVSIWGTDLNHSIRGYEMVLRRGFSGLRSEVESRLASIPLTDPDAAHKRANLLGWLRLCDASISLGRRHAEDARRMSADATDPDVAREWAEIAEVCERVPAEPARNFREALQSLWFAHMITVWEDGVNANGIGRLDQFLWPYLEEDIRLGRLTWESAAELLAAFWVKLYQTYDVQQMMIGGQKPDGTDAVNPLSYLVLDVTEGMGFVRCLSARVHKDSPREFMSRCVDLVAKGGGIPFFFNDDALVPALASNGIPIEDARGYAAIGCIEITIPGKANPHAVSNWINLPKCLELALNGGRDLRDGVQIGPDTGTLADFGSIDDVLNAFDTQLEHMAERCVYGSNSAELTHRSQYRLPYLSLLTEGCVEKGLDIIEGGARYNYHCSAAVGIPNAADSLAALKTAVFDEKMITPEGMLAALRTNFADDDGLRLYLRNRLPKYGNDEPVPDGFAAELTRRYCERMGRYTTVTGGRFLVHLFTFTLMLSLGQLTGASPDGRSSGEPLAYSVSPGQGRDREGLTAVINSLSRIPHYLAAASSSAILEADPSLIEGIGKERFVDLLITAVRQGVGQMQFNVVSADTLRAAQSDPDSYRNLSVRVSGFSQQFRLLDKTMQDHIIARTKHRR